MAEDWMWAGSPETEHPWHRWTDRPYVVHKQSHIQNRREHCCSTYFARVQRAENTLFDRVYRSRTHIRVYTCVDVCQQYLYNHIRSPLLRAIHKKSIKQSQLNSIHIYLPSRMVPTIFVQNTKEACPTGEPISVGHLWSQQNSKT